MEYVRRVDFDALDAGEGRLSQALVDSGSGAKGCSVNCIRTPAGEGSPAGMHTHAVDQVFYVLRGTMSLTIDGEDYERLYKQHADQNPQFWEYRQKTSRKIPVVLLERLEDDKQA